MASPNKSFWIDTSLLTPAIRRLKNGPEIVQEEIVRGLQRVGFAVEREAKQRVRVRTGHLRRSITSVVETSDISASVSIGSNLPYAKAQDLGSGIYGPNRSPIVPKSKKVLSWQGPDGTWVHRKSVRGVRGKYYLSAPFRAMRKAIRTELTDKTARRIIKRLKSGASE